MSAGPRSESLFARAQEVLPGGVIHSARSFGWTLRALVQVHRATGDPRYLEAAKTAGIPAEIIGRTGGSALTLSGGTTISLEDLRDAHEGWLPGYMGQP